MPKLERCQSGLMCTLGKRVLWKQPQVQILSSPPIKFAFEILFNKVFKRFFMVSKEKTEVPSPIFNNVILLKIFIKSAKNRNSDKLVLIWQNGAKETII